MKKYSVCYPTRISSTRGDAEEILIGRHKDSEGARKLKMVNKWNGVGGKFEAGIDKDMFDCATRECHQESGLVPRKQTTYRAGIITFNNNGIVAEVHFFFTSMCDGTLLAESEEMAEFRWHTFAKLPYDQMMDADRKFRLPEILYAAMWRNGYLTNTIIHSADMEVVSHSGFVFHLYENLSQPQHS